MANFLTTSEKLTYLKRTGKKGDFRYWYWHKKLQTIIHHRKPKNLEINLYPCYLNHPNIINREFQVGDIVFHFPTEQFGVLLSYKKSLWLTALRKGEQIQCRESSLKFIGPNLYGKSNSEEDNLLGLKTTEELNFAESLGEFSIQNYLEKRSFNLTFTEKTFIHFHYLMFKHVYAWAGKYYIEEEIVVGRHNAPTLPRKKVKEKMKLIFKKVQDFQTTVENKNSLVTLLANLHTEIAWIHPFKDGNGRIIRLFSDLLAFESGYKLQWNLENVKERKSYHRAVSLAVNKNNLEKLYGIINKSIAKK